MSTDQPASSGDSEKGEEYDRSSKPTRKRSLLSQLRVGILLLAAAVVLIVAARNWEPVSVDLVGQKIEVALSVLVILTFLCGTVIGLLIAYFRPWRKQD